MKRSLLVMTAVIVFSLFLATGAFATIRCVNPLGTGGCFNNIQGAIDASSSGDTVTVYAGTYYTLGELTIDGLDHFTLQGSGKVVIDNYQYLGSGSTTDYGIDISNSNGVTIKYLTLRNSNSYQIYGESTAPNLSIMNVQVLSGNDEGIDIDGTWR